MCIRINKIKFAFPLLILIGSSACKEPAATEGFVTADEPNEDEQYEPVYPVELSTRELLDQDNPRACATSDTKQLVLRLLDPTYEQAVTQGLPAVELSAISTLGSNPAINEIECSGSITVSIPRLNVTRNGTINYKIRPSLESDYGFVVQSLPSNAFSVMRTYVAGWRMSKNKLLSSVNDGNYAVNGTELQQRYVDPTPAKDAAAEAIGAASAAAAAAAAEAAIEAAKEPSYYGSEPNYSSRSDDRTPAQQRYDALSN